MTPITDKLVATLMRSSPFVTSREVESMIRDAVAPLERSHAELLQACKALLVCVPCHRNGGISPAMPEKDLSTVASVIAAAEALTKGAGQ